MSTHREIPWRDRLDAYLRQEANPPHKFGHQPRLFALVRQIAVRTPDLVYDEDVVFAAAYLHDVGVFIGHRPEEPHALVSWDHVRYACEHTPALLMQFGFPAEKVPAVLACIREHQPQDVPHSPEAILLRDADILEQLGATAVLRTAAKLGSDTRFHHFADGERSLRRALAVLPAQLKLSASRDLAKPRVHLLETFLAALLWEAGEHLG